MDNPLHVLKQAIRLRNWKMVEAAYMELTGEEPPSPLPSRTSGISSNVNLAPRDETEHIPVEIYQQVVDGFTQEDESSASGLILGTEDDLEALEQGEIEALGEEEEEETPPVSDETLNLLNQIIQTRVEATPPAPAAPASPPVPPHRADINDFRIHRDPNTSRATRTRSEGGTYTRDAGPEPPMKKNAYRDNLAVARRELVEDQNLIKQGARPPQPVVERRDPAGTVTVVCRECERAVQVQAGEAPARRLAKDDTKGSTYICDNCIAQKRKGRVRGE